MNINEPAPTAAISLPFTKAADPEATFSHTELRMPYLRKLPDAWRNHFVAMCGEYVGTVLFLFFALSGTQVANSINSSAGLTVAETGANPQQLQYIALCFGFSLAVNAWVFFRISGGLFNPAVSIGMCLIGALPWLRGCLLCLVQILGGITAAALVSCMFPGALKSETTLGGGTSIVQGLFIEMILTAQLVFTIYMLAAEKHKGTFIAPVGIGLSLFVAELTGVFFTGGSLNPARSFGPAVVNHHFDGYHWIYWVGPLLGAILASGFFKFIKMLEYETVNPDQDAGHKRSVAIAAAHASGNDYEKHHSAHNGLDSNTTVSGHGLQAVNRNKESVDDSSQPTGSTNLTANGLREPTAGFGTGLSRPAVVQRESQRVRTESPRMGSVDDAYHGLAHGMHGTDITNSRIQPPGTEARPSGERTASGMV